MVIFFTMLNLFEYRIRKMIRANAYIVKKRNLFFRSNSFLACGMQNQMVAIIRNFNFASVHANSKLSQFFLFLNTEVRNI